MDIIKFFVRFLGPLSFWRKFLVWIFVEKSQILSFLFVPFLLLLYSLILTVKMIQVLYQINGEYTHLVIYNYLQNIAILGFPLMFDRQIFKVKKPTEVKKSPFLLIIRRNWDDLYTGYLFWNLLYNSFWDKSKFW